jgi:Rrf2 family protein
MAANDKMNMSAAYLNKKLEIPYPYLRQILSNLARSGFIYSRRGRRGGYAFLRDTDKITLADIIEATDGLESLSRCILGFRECPFNNPCAMHNIWEKTRNDIIKVLKETSLKDISVKR